MSNAHGTLIFSKSNDCLFDQGKLLKKLNSYTWALDDTQWQINHISGQIKPTHFGSYDPTVYPSKFTKVLAHNDNGTQSWIDINNFLGNPHDVCDSELDEDVTIDQICSDIAEAISQGWIEIAVAAEANASYAYFQQLKIFACGKGVRLSCVSGIECEDWPRAEFTTNYLASPVTTTVV